MKEDKLAVLIDADNVSSASIKEMLDEMSKLGTPTIKRIYADWTKPTVSPWKAALLANAITPIQQYSYTTGKNSSDSALIIDAMDLLYSEKVDGFCIVSSDSDFTRLAIRLREAGMKVYGFGEQKTPQPFITACDKFIYIEILKPNIVAAESNTRAQNSVSPESKPLTKIAPEILEFITESVAAITDDSGWASLAALGFLLAKRKPDFDSRNYGFPKLLPLIKSMNKFEIDEREAGVGNIKHIYLKIRQNDRG